LITSGTGHIRFWKMASTFTGLKLQGDIGKFGKVELSDIVTFVELPGGKVISSTDMGALLIWEGNFIKMRVMQSAQLPCHNGQASIPLLLYVVIRLSTGHISRLVGRNAIYCHGWVRWLDKVLGCSSYHRCRTRPRFVS